MKVFLSGPVSGLSKEAYTQSFARAGAMLIRQGLSVVNPVTLTNHLPDGTPWREYMDLCITALLKCDAIYMMNGWQHSRGAKIEKALAKSLGLIVMYEPESV